jgi:hypothetical protein
MFKMAGKLTHYFVVDEQFHTLKDEDVLPFEVFYEVLLKWSLNQEKMSYNDFALYEEQKSEQEDIEAFKKMTDRIL